MTLNLGTMGLGLGANTGTIPSWAQGSDMWWDFTANNGFPSSLLSSTHAQSIYADDSSGVYSSFSANTVVRTNKGVQTVPTRTNLFANTADLDGYLNTNADKVSITQNLPGPDGSANQAATFTVIGTNEGRLRNITVANDSSTYALSFFVKKTTGTPANYPGVFSPLTGGTGGASIVIVVDTTAGTANSSGSPGNLTITSYGQWWRVSWTITNNSTGNTTLGFRLYPAFNLNGSTTFNASATGSAVFAWPQIEVGGFASPPILTSGSAAAVSGPQQVIDIGSRAALGVGGVIQVDVKDPGSNYVRLFETYDVAGAQNRVSFLYVVGRLRLEMYVAAAQQASLDLGAWPSGLTSIVFAAGSNYVQGCIVGGALPTADTVATYPALDRVAIGGLGSSAGQNAYQLTKRLALKFGPQDATTFADLYSKAQILDTYV